MKPYRHFASRDQFSGHWWIKLEKLGISLEMWKSGRWNWNLHGIYQGGKSLVNYTNLDPKMNVVYPVFERHIIPDFCTIRAALRWVEYGMGQHVLDFL